MYKITALASILFLAGCASTSVTPLNDNKYQAKDINCRIQVLSTLPIDKPYEELAILSAVTGQTIFHGKDLNAMLPSMKKEACKLGADAIFLKHSEAGGIPWVKATQGNASGVAIKFNDA